MEAVMGLFFQGQDGLNSWEQYTKKQREFSGLLLIEAPISSVVL